MSRGVLGHTEAPCCGGGATGYLVFRALRYEPG